MTLRLNPDKLLLSKWTATAPVRKEKHFLVTRLLRDDAQRVTHCVLEAVLTQREQTLAWTALQDAAVWQAGWK